MNRAIKIEKFQAGWRLVVLLALAALLWGCDDFLQTDPPVGQIPSKDVFENEGTARAAVTTLYAKLRDEVLVTGSSAGLGLQLGLYADELEYHGLPGQPLEAFFGHRVLGNDPLAAQIWNSSYKLVYMCNAAIEGLEGSAGLKDEVRDGLLGEALFVRALVYSYLVELFGAVPYITTTDYRANSTVSRAAAPVVFEGIIADLQAAKPLLDDSFASGARVRATSWAASALCARAYLYQGRWEEAEQESGLLLGNAALFSMGSAEQEFEASSASSILQLRTRAGAYSTHEAATFVFASGPPPLVALGNGLVESMENGDLRRLYWIGTVSEGGTTWYYPNKYRQGDGTQHSVVLRLAEQYLIRAEARAQRNDLEGAILDLDRVRNRAGLGGTQATTRQELLEAILMERRHELFAEYGHRWMDLKRTGNAAAVLSALKPGWKPTDLYLPVPESELAINPNLRPQNAGY